MSNFKMDFYIKEKTLLEFKLKALIEQTKGVNSSFCGSELYEKKIIERKLRLLDNFKTYPEYKLKELLLQTDITEYVKYERGIILNERISLSAEKDAIHKQMIDLMTKGLDATTEFTNLRKRYEEISLRLKLLEQKNIELITYTNDELLQDFRDNSKVYNDNNIDLDTKECTPTTMAIYKMMQTRDNNNHLQQMLMHIKDSRVAKDTIATEISIPLNVGMNFRFYLEDNCGFTDSTRKVNYNDLLNLKKSLELLERRLLITKSNLSYFNPTVINSLINPPKDYRDLNKLFKNAKTDLITDDYDTFLRLFNEYKELRNKTFKFIKTFIRIKELEKIMNKLANTILEKITNSVLLTYRQIIKTLGLEYTFYPITLNNLYRNYEFIDGKTMDYLKDINNFLSQINNLIGRFDEKRLSYDLNIDKIVKELAELTGEEVDSLELSKSDSTENLAAFDEAFIAGMVQKFNVQVQNRITSNKDAKNKELVLS